MHDRSLATVNFTRRQLALTCVGPLITGTLGAAASFQGIEINHVALRVSDLMRSADFIRAHLGAPGIIFEKPGQRYLRVGQNFTALFQKAEPGLDHFAISVEGYEADVVERKCRALGLQTRRSSSFVYVHDPDEIEVQLAHVDHEVRSPVVRPAPETSTFKGTGINHVALRVTDVGRSRDFYQRHFGMPVLRQGHANCFLGLGANFVALFQGDRPGLDHFCYSIEDYDPESAMTKLEGLSLSARRDADRVYFNGPDGITIQIASERHQP